MLVSIDSCWFTIATSIATLSCPRARFLVLTFPSGIGSAGLCVHRLLIIGLCCHCGPAAHIHGVSACACCGMLRLCYQVSFALTILESSTALLSAFPPSPAAACFRSRAWWCRCGAPSWLQLLRRSRQLLTSFRLNCRAEPFRPCRDGFDLTDARSNCRTKCHQRPETSNRAYVTPEALATPPRSPQQVCSAPETRMCSGGI